MPSTLVKVPPKLTNTMGILTSYKQHFDELKKTVRNHEILEDDERLVYRLLPRAMYELYCAACVDFPEFEADLERIIGVQHGVSEEQRTKLMEIDNYIHDLQLKRKQYSSK